MQTTPTSIKLLVIDIDGTLLNPQGEITPATLASIHAAQQAGIVVTLATARRYCNTATIATELGLAGPLILYDGGSPFPVLEDLRCQDKGRDTTIRREVLAFLEVKIEVFCFQVLSLREQN